MAGTKAGGKKTAATNIARYGKDYYKNMGRKGGANGHTGGFYANPEMAQIAGAKGGRISSRKGIKNGCGKSRTRKQQYYAKAQLMPEHDDYLFQKMVKIHNDFVKGATGE